MAAETVQERERFVTWREMAPVIGWAIGVMALTVLPYLWAISRAAPDQQFQGFLWGVDEGNVYLQWMRQASEGRVLLRNQYTTMPQNPHFLNVFLLVLGRVMAWTGLPGGIVFHIARLLGGIVLLVMIYLLAALLSRSKAVRWGALALASLSAGFGWLAAAWASTVPDHLPPPLRPPDYAPLPPQTWQVQPEAFTFLSLLLNPLFVWSMALICAVLIGAVLTLERKSFGWAAVTGVLMLVIGNVHGYDVLVLHATIVTFAALAVVRGEIRLAHAAALYLVIFAIGLPSVAWAWWTAQQDPAYLQKINTPTLSPRVRDMAAGYGLVLLLALPGAWYALRHWRTDPRLMLPVCWAATNAVLIYAVKPVAAPEFHWEPLFAFQRKMAEGLHIPLCVLAAVALVQVIAPALQSKRRAEERARSPLLITLAVVLSLPSNALFVADCLHNVATNNLEYLRYLQPPMYLTFDEVRGMEALATRAGEDDVVLCSSFTGNYIPPRAACLVFAGHWAETLHFGEAVDFVGEFLLPGRSPEVLRAALDAAGADYVFYGPYEALLAQQMMLASENEPPEDPAAEFREATRGFLTPIFARGDVTVYSYSPDAPVFEAPVVPMTAAPDDPSTEE